MARNEIIIEGVRHIFTTDGIGFYPCRYCSLKSRCEDDPVCQRVFGKKGMFEIHKKKEK